MKQAPTIVEFVRDRHLLGLSISPAQETLLRVLYGLPLSPEQLTIYGRCTGRQNPPSSPVGEGTIISGARSGKDSRIAGPVVCYEALFGGHEKHLHRGERAVIPLVAPNERSTRIAFGYIRDYLTRSSLLAGQVAEVLASEITLTSGVAVYCFPCTIRSLRGWSIPCGVMDEPAFYNLEGAADSDVEILTAIRRGMVGFPAPKLLKISTPYMRSGVIWEDFQTFGDEDPDRLVWRSTSTEMNPSLMARLARFVRLDPRRAAREYDAEFIEDAAAAYAGEWLDAAVVPGRHELPPRPGISYVGATDPTGGGGDVFSLVILHREGSGPESRLVVDAVRGRAHVGAKLEALVGEYAVLLKSYNCREVNGDKYAGGWPRQEFLRHGIVYRDASGDKSEALLALEPLLAQGRVELLDHPELLRELRLLERRARAGGRTVIEAPRGAHDDYSTSLAHAAEVASAGGWIEGDLRQFAAFAPPLTSAQLPPEVYDPALAPPWSRDAGGRTDGESAEDWARARGLNPDADAPWNIYGD